MSLSVIGVMHPGRRGIEKEAAVLGSCPCRMIVVAAMFVAALLLLAPWRAEAGVVKLSSSEYACLQGYVYMDLDRDSAPDVGEALIPGVVIRCTLVEPTPAGGGLTGSTASAGTTYTATTDKYGDYCFDWLPAGKYCLDQEDPVEFKQGLTPSSAGTVNNKCTGSPNGPDGYAEIT